MLEDSDAAFLADVEACRIPNRSFGHREHVRAAWAYITCCGFARASTMMDATIRRFAAHHGHAQKYHHTMTAAWMHLVAAHAVPHAAQGFDEFIKRHSRLLDKALIEHYYSREALFSDRARGHWIEPDLRPFPEIV